LPLWDATQTLPKAADLPQVKDAEFHVLKKQRPDEDGCNFTLGVGLVWHKGKLYASYGFNKGDENTASEEAHVRVSEDGGKTWAFMGAFHAHTQLYHRVHARAYLLNETTGVWESQGAVINDGFWPMQEPQKLANGNWLMAGLRIGAQCGASQL
jgi:hypothetical protein